MRFAPSWNCRWFILSIHFAVSVAGGCRPGASGTNSSAVSSANSKPADGNVAPDALLESAIEILQSNKRSTMSHQVAAQRLNQFLHKSRAAGPALLEPLSLELEKTLANGLTPEQLLLIKSEQFDRPDSLHMEACFLRRDVVKHVTAGISDDLGKVLAVFDWVIRNVQIVDPNQAPPIPLTTGLALILGSGTAEERAWTFIELLRQIEIDGAMLAHAEKDQQTNRFVFTPLLPVVWLDNSLYLFDTTIGLPVPGANGEGIATLRDLQANPELLAQLDLDAEHPYRIRPEHLTKLVVWLESTPDYWSPRMQFLQDRLPELNRAILWSNFFDVYARFRRATSESVDFDLWPLPKTIERVARTQEYVDHVVGTREQLLGVLTPYQFFGGSDVRAAHLHAHWQDAIPEYLANRVSMAEWSLQEKNRMGLRAIAVNASKQAPMSEKLGQEVAACVPDLYDRIREDSTYFLGVAKFEQGDYKSAANWMGKSYLETYPNGRWASGALYHLGRCSEAQQDFEKAITFYTRDRASAQAHGNLIRARRLGWKPNESTPKPSESRDATENPATNSP
jgi:hypothetical protein